MKPVYEKYHGQGFEIVSIGYSAGEKFMREFVEKNKVSWPNTYKTQFGEHPFWDAYGFGGGWNHTFLLDKKGLMVKMYDQLSFTTLEDSLRQALAQPPF